MSQLYQEFQKVDRILNSIQGKLEKIFTHSSNELEQMKQPGYESRPNNRILKEYNGEPLNPRGIPSISHFDIEEYSQESKIIEERIFRIQTLLGKIERALTDPESFN